MTSRSQNDQKLTRMALFINCARQLIDEEGYQNVSIRKIADRAGYHNSTIYFYFSDLDYLLALASVRSFEEYSKDLAGISSLNKSNKDVFYAIWESFCRAAFSKPDESYQLFFGKYKDQITEILNQYYRLFPEEKQAYSDVIEDMYFTSNFTDRCRALLKPLMNDPDTKVTADTFELINTITVSVFESMLREKKESPDTNNRTLTKNFLNILHFIVDA